MGKQAASTYRQAEFATVPDDGRETLQRRLPIVPAQSSPTWAVHAHGSAIGPGRVCENCAHPCRESRNIDRDRFLHRYLCV